MSLGGTGSEKTLENVRFGGFWTLGLTGARGVFWENFAGAVLVAFGGRFFGLFGVVFGCVSNHFRRLRRALGVLLRLTWSDFERLSNHLDAVVV